MLIGIFSDIHDNVHNLKLAIAKMKERGISKALFLGDFINPGVVQEIINSGIIVYAVWGNNDGERTAITKMICHNPDKIGISDTTFANFKIENRVLFLTHHPDFAKSLAKSGDYHAVFYGHDHLQYTEVLPNGCILANPGEISAHRTGRATFLIYDSEKNAVELIELTGTLNVNS